MFLAYRMNVLQVVTGGWPAARLTRPSDSVSSTPIGDGVILSLGSNASNINPGYYLPVAVQFESI